MLWFWWSSDNCASYLNWSKSDVLIKTVTVLKSKLIKILKFWLWLVNIHMSIGLTDTSS